MIYDPTILHEDLIAAGLPIVGCASNGRIDWMGVPTAAELDKAEEVKAAHDPDRRTRAERAARDRLRALATKLEDGSATPADIREALALLIRRSAP